MPSIVSNSELLVALLKDVDTISEQHQAALTLFHRLVEASVRKFLGFDPCYQQHVQFLPIQRRRFPTRSLQLPNFPVRRISSLIVDENGYSGQAPNAFTSDNGAETLTAGVDYYLTGVTSGMGGTNGLDADDIFSATGIVERVDGYWPMIQGSVKVTYWAGYTVQELRGFGDYHFGGIIKKATVEALLWNFRQVLAQAKAAGGVGSVKTSETMGDYSYTISDMAAVVGNLTVHLPNSVSQSLQTVRSYNVAGA